MLKLSKRVEYALLSVQEMARRRGYVVSAKDIATRFEISQTLVAKVLQQLAQKNIIRSFHGVHGGYELALEPQCLSIADVIEAIEGRSGAIVECQDHHGHDTANCNVLSTCTIREPLSILQERIAATFNSMTVAELTPQTIVPLIIEH
jgi:Rrf2 family protein